MQTSSVASENCSFMAAIVADRRLNQHGGNRPIIPRLKWNRRSRPTFYRRPSPQLNQQAQLGRHFGFVCGHASKYTTALATARNCCLSKRQNSVARGDSAISGKLAKGSGLNGERIHAMRRSKRNWGFERLESRSLLTGVVTITGDLYVALHSNYDQGRWCRQSNRGS